jgi:hypothetical protein
MACSPAPRLPWWTLATGVVLAVATSVLAARRPARTAARVPVVAALSGRPPEPKAVHRSATLQTRYVLTLDTGELRTLTAVGASSRVRRTITGATAGALGLLGAILGAAVATIAGVTWARSSLSSTFGDVPVVDLLLILVGLPLVAAVGGWLLAGRQPPAISRQPLE